MFPQHRAPLEVPLITCPKCHRTVEQWRRVCPIQIARFLNAGPGFFAFLPCQLLPLYLWTFESTFRTFAWVIAAEKRRLTNYHISFLIGVVTPGRMWPLRRHPRGRVDAIRVEIKLSTTYARGHQSGCRTVVIVPTVPIFISCYNSSLKRCFGGYLVSY